MKYTVELSEQQKNNIVALLNRVNVTGIQESQILLDSVHLIGNAKRVEVSEDGRKTKSVGAK